MNSKLLSLLITLVSYSATAQIYFSEATDIKVTDNNNTLDAPFTGGYNNAQFAEIDLNYDGILDLVVFDRFKGLVRPYINEGIFDSISYSYAPEYAEKFPEMDQILITRDYNNDGKLDVYVVGSNIDIYENTGNASEGLSFQIISKVRSMYNATNIPPSIVNPGAINYPAIVDIEGDKDMDIIYRSNSRTLDFHRNFSIDRNNDFDPIYERTGACWGFVSFGSKVGSFSIDSIRLNNCRGITRGERLKRNKHSEAMSTTAIDIDLNSSIDLLTSDIESYQMRLLLNADSTIGTNKVNSEIFKVIDSFPNSDTPVKLLYATAYFIDVDNDGKKDMIASSSHANTTRLRPYGKEDIWLYKNIATNNGYRFHLKSKSFLNKSSLDFGRNSKPVFIDFNKDGLEDILVGNGGYLPDNNTQKYVESLSLLQNIGTKQKPEFDLIDNNYLKISSLNISSGLDTFPLAAPAVGDIDGDGDDDLLIVQYDQNIYWFEDTSSTGNIAAFKFHAEPYQSIKGNDAITLFDVDKNGTLDLIGNTPTQVRYFTNFGTPNAPLYSIKLDSFLWIGGDTMRYFIKTPPNYSLFKLGDSLAVEQALNSDNNTSIPLIIQKIDTINHYFDCINTIDFGVGGPQLDELNTTAVINFYRKTWQIYRFNPSSGRNELARIENVFLFEDKGENTLYAGGQNNTTYKITKFTDSLRPIYRNDSTPRISMANYGNSMFLNGSDLNGDSIIDLAVGIATGGIKILYGSRVNNLDEQTITENKNNNSLLLYPNPSSGILNIIFRTETNKINNQLEVRNISGKLILSDQFTGQYKNIDLSEFPNGVYFITVRNKRKVFSQKLILQP